MIIEYQNEKKWNRKIIVLVFEQEFKFLKEIWTNWKPYSLIWSTKNQLQLVFDLNFNQRLIRYKRYFVPVTNNKIYDTVNWLSILRSFHLYMKENFQWSIEAYLLYIHFFILSSSLTPFIFLSCFLRKFYNPFLSYHKKIHFFLFVDVIVFCSTQTRPTDPIVLHHYMIVSNSATFFSLFNWSWIDLWSIEHQTIEAKRNQFCCCFYPFYYTCYLFYSLLVSIFFFVGCYRCWYFKSTIAKMFLY